MKTIDYVRVSTEDQFTNGVSLDAQQEKILQYAELYNVNIIETISDLQVYAKDLNRPGATSD